MTDGAICERSALPRVCPRGADQRREGPLAAAFRADRRDGAEHKAYWRSRPPQLARESYGLAGTDATCPLNRGLEVCDDAFAGKVLRRRHRHSMVQVPARRAVARRSELLESWRTCDTSGTGNAISLQAQVAGECHRRGRIRLVRRADVDPRRLGVLSTGERRCESRGASGSHRDESQDADRRQRSDRVLCPIAAIFL